MALLDFRKKLYYEKYVNKITLSWNILQINFIDIRM